MADRKRVNESVKKEKIMKKLLIIDSNSILNRAFYGIRYLSNSKGVPTNAIYGFLNILLKLIKDEKPDYICAAFDLKAPTFRHKMYSQYKAQRKPMPEGLAEQMPLARELVKVLGIMCLELEGYEADDIIGTVSAICEKEGVSCKIATGDKDDLQLASQNTNVILTVSKQGVTETNVFDDKAVFEKYGVTPEEFIDVKALMGDASDNIPGVAGIGEKTALKLIANNHSIEKIYENPENAGVKGAMLQKLTDGRESAFLSKTLATIDRNVPIPFEFADCEFSGFLDTDGKIYSFLAELELHSIIKKLELAPNTEEKTEVDWFSSISVQESFDFLDGEDRISVLLEFTGNSLTGAGFGVKDKVIVKKTGLTFTEEDLISQIKPYLENENIKKIVYDIKDAMVKLSGKIDIRNIAADVAIGAYLAEPSRSDYDISGVAHDFLGAVIEKEEAKEAQISLIDDEEEQDTAFIKRVSIIEPLWEYCEKKLKEQGQESLYFDIELPLIKVLADMQIKGFYIDKAELKKFGEKLGVDIKRLTEEIYSLSGEEFNINSPKQLGVILFEKLGLPIVKKTKKGYSTNADVLEKLYDKHPIIEKIMEYRHLTKLKNAYCDGMEGLIDNEGRIHSVFNQTVTVTGRISSTEPNLQNIPTRTALGRELRKMFTAPDDEHILVDADYSQIELRVLAHIADDEVMKNAFLNGEDIHAVTASQVFNTPLEEVSSEQRSAAKAVNFGIVYGIGEYSLSQDLKISVKEAKEYIKNYLAKYTGVSEYMARIKEEAKEKGYVKTLYNRIRFIPEIKSSNFVARSFGERVALNTPIQGTAADIIKLAMVRVYERLKSEGLKSQLVLQVHDELIIEALKTEEERVLKILKEEMENAMPLCVPLTVDMSSGKRWYDTK